MGVIVPVGEVQCVLRWLVAGDPEEMVTTFGASGIGPFADAQAFAVSLAAAAASTISDSTKMSNDYTFVGSTVYVKQDDGDSIVAESVVNEAGGGSWPALPNNCAFLIKKSTASAGPDARGRCFLPPFRVGEDDVNPAGIIDNGARASIQSDWNDFIDAIEAAISPEELVLFHSDGAPSTPITGWTVDTKIATVRRRMRR